MYKLPRLHVETLSECAATITEAQWHYLKNVLRCKKGDGVRLFNETAGEYRAMITDDGKRPALEVRDLLRYPPPSSRAMHLYVPPLPKDRMDFLIEKATELGMTDYHPLLTERAAIRSVNQNRLRAQAIEATEQCERLDVPRIHNPVVLVLALGGEGVVYTAVERLRDPSSSTSEATPNVGSGIQHKIESAGEYNKLPDSRLRGNDDNDVSILIGPPGGWTDAEREILLAKTTPLDLGERVLRSETAALAALMRITYS